jgi:hypothetical protein
MCAMLPRRVGGADVSRTDSRSFLVAELNDQFPNVSLLVLLLTPFVKGGGVAGRDLTCGCEAVCNE